MAVAFSCFVGVAQGVFNTEPGTTLSGGSTTVLAGEALPTSIFRMSFGFSTDEILRPGEIPDSFTISVQNSGSGKSLILVTADAGGAVWAPPTPGTVPISPDSIVFAPVDYPSLTPVLAVQMAYELEFQLPADFLGQSLSVSFDLFSNDNGLRSQGWYSQPVVIPEPGVLPMMILAAVGLVVAVRRPGRNGRRGGVGVHAWLWILALWCSGQLWAEDKAFRIGNAELVLSEVTSEADVYFRSMRLNRALNVWNVEMTVSNKSSRVLNGPLVLLVDSVQGTSGLIGPDGLDDSQPGKAYLDLTVVAGNGSLSPGEVTSARTLTLGRTATGSPALVTRLFAARPPTVATLAVTRSLDDSGRPLPGVAVTGSGPGGALDQRSDLTSGVASFGRGAGEHRIRFSREGYLPVWRSVRLAADQTTVVPNPRLTLRSPATFSLTPLGGTVISNAGGGILLQVPPGAVGEPLSATLTSVSAQDLPAFLPKGWSPLAAFWLESSGPLQSPLPGMLKPSGPIGSGETAALVRWDEASLEWRVVVTVAGRGTNSVPVEIGTAGAYALVAGDLGALAPPSPIAGQPLLGSAALDSDVGGLSATGTVTPSISPASVIPEQVTGTAHVVLRHSTSALPSGTILRGEVTETYRLRDGGLRLSPQYEEFIVGYQRPGDGDPLTLDSEFPMRPLLLFGPDQLAEATVKVDVLPEQPFDGQVLDPTGGQISAGNVRLLAGTGRLNAPSALRLRSLEATAFTNLVSGSDSVVAAFDLTVDASTLAGSLDLQLGGLTPAGRFVLARILSDTGYYGLQPVDRLQSDGGGGLRSLEPAAGERLSGLRGSGQYLLVSVREPQGLVSGIARNGAGATKAGMPVSLSGLPWLALTDADGRYQLVAPAGSRDLVVRDPATGDAGVAAITVADPGTGLSQDVGTAPQGPRVARITPAAGSVRVPRVVSVVVEFDEAVHPGSVVGGIQLLRPDDSVVPTSLSLNLGNRIATLNPATELDANTVYRVRLAPSIRDPGGLPLEGAQEFSFTTVPLSTRDPAAQLIIYQPGATNVPAVVLAGIPAYRPGTNSLAVVVHGTSGVADPEVPVVLVNESTGETSTVLSKADGSFSSVINGTEDDFISATFVNLNGTRVRVPVSRQEFDDGFVGLYPQGGILEAQSDGGPVQVLIEPKAIESKTKLRLKPMSPAQVAELLGGVEPDSARAIAPPLVLEGDGQPMSGPIKVSFTVNLASGGYPTNANPLEAAVALVRVTDTDGVKAFEVLDQLAFKPAESQPIAARAGLRTAGLPVPTKDGEQLFFGTVNSVIGLIPQAGIANNVFRYALMPILVGGKPIVVKGRVLQSYEVTKAENPFQVDNPLLSGFQFDQLGKAFKPLDLAGQAISSVNQTTEELTDLLLGRAVGGAFVTLQNYLTPAVPGRLRPGVVYCTSDRDGKYLMVAPTTPLLQLKPEDFYLLRATHPRFRDVQTEQLFALNDMSIAGVAFKNFVFREPLPLTSAPNVNVAHFPPYPAAGEAVQLQVNASQGFAGAPRISVFVERVFPTNQSIASVRILDPKSETVGNRTQWSGRIQATNTITEVELSISSLTSSGTVHPRIPYAIRFDGAPAVDDGPIVDSDPSEKKGPSVVATFPDDNGFITDTGELTIIFNEPINRRVESNVAGILLSGPAAGAVPAVRLSPDQTVLTIQYGGLSPGAEYSLTLSGVSITDLSGNPLDQRPSSVEPDAFTLHFRTAQFLRYKVPGVVNGVGSAINGALLYVLDNAQVPVLRTFDISNPTEPKELSSVRVVGNARDLVVIPNYSYKLSIHERTITGDLVAVVGGNLDLIQEDLDGDGKADNSLVKGQYLRVFDMANPSQPVELAAPIVSYRVGSAVSRVRWVPPNLVYQEFGADIQQLAVVNLQEMLIGFSATRQQVDRFGDGNLGKDANNDGDYADPGDVVPVPPRLPTEFFGKRESYVIGGSTQKILDFSISGGTVGVTLSGGVTLTQGGQPTGTAVLPQYRTLAFNGQELDGNRSSVNFASADYLGKVTIIDGLPIEVDGRLQTPVAALISLSPDRLGRHRLVVLDISLPELPRTIADVTLPGEITGGQLRSIVQRPDGLLELITVSHILVINPEFLARPNPPAGQLHPSVVGYLPNAGGRMRSTGTSTFGVHAVAEGGRNELIQTAPTLQFVRFPSSAEIVDPSSISRAETNLIRLMAKARPAAQLVPARVRPDHLGHVSDLFPANPAVHYHVLVEAPGGAGEKITLGLEGTGWSGWPLPNKGVGFPPVRAVSEESLEVLGTKLRPTCDAPIRPLTAYRMSNDTNSDFYNRYLSRPFVVVYESVSKPDLVLQKLTADREILWSGANMRAFIEPSEVRNPVIGPFAATVDTRRSVLQPVASATVRTLDVSYIMGPNPPPPGGDEPLDGTYGSISAHSGEFRTEATDLSLPSPRMSIEIERAIGGQDTYEGPFGLGWDFNYNQRLTELQPQLFPEGFKMPLIARADLGDSVVGSSKDVLFHTGAGRMVLFRWISDSMPPEFVADPLVRDLAYGDKAAEYFLPEPGVFDLLVKFKDGKFERLTPDGLRYRYAANGRLETIIDRFPANRHELEYDRNGWLRRIDDRSVTSDRFVEFGYYRREADPEFTSGLDERTDNAYILGKICRLRDYAGRDVLYFYSDEGLLIRREGILVAGENGGFSGRNHTGYVYEGCRIKGVTVGTAGTPLISAATTPGTGGVPVAKSGSGLGVSTEVTVPVENSARTLENQKTSTKQGDGRVTEITLDKFGQPTLTRVSGPGTDPAETRQESDANGLVTLIQFPEGRIHRMSYDTNNPVFRSRGNLLSTTVDPGSRGGEGYTETQAYDPRYNLPSGEQKNANGFVITHRLSADGRRTESIRHGEAGTETQEFNDRGQMTRRVDVDGIETSSEFEAGTAFLKVTRKGEYATELTYDGSVAGKLGQPAASRPPRGATIQVAYNANLQEVEITRGSHVQRFAYDEQGRSVAQVELLGDGKRLDTQLVIDAKGFVLSRKMSGVEVDGTESTLEYAYVPDELSRVKQVTHPGGSVQRFSYNALGHPIRMELETYVEEYKTDRHGNVQEVKKGGDVVQSTEFDGLDRAKIVRRFAGEAPYLTERSYFPGGEVKRQRITDPEYGVVEDHEVAAVDALGRVLERTVHGSAVTRTDTYTHGVLSRSSKGPRQTVEDRWNSAGYPIARSDSILAATFTPDGNGNVERVVRQEEGAVYTEVTTFSELDHPETVADSFGPMGSFVTRSDGKNLEAKNARNNTTRFEYSALGEMTRRVRPDGMEFRFRHDPQRQLKYSGDPSAGFGFGYDNLFRLTRRSQRNGAESVYSDFDARNNPKLVTIPGGTIRMGYDREGRPTNSTASFGTTSYASGRRLDALGRARIQNYRDGAGTQNRSVWTFDMAGPLVESRFEEEGATFVVGYGYRDDLSRRSIVYPSGIVLNEERDGAGRLVAISTSLGDILRVTDWQGNAQPRTVRLGDVIQTDHRYDSRGRLWSSRSVRIAGGNVLSHLRLQYDAANNVEIRQYLHRQGRSDNFSYDNGERLTRAQIGGLLTDAQAEPLRLIYQRTYQFSSDGLDLLLAAPTLGPPDSVPPFAGKWSGHDAFLLPGAIDDIPGNPPDALGRVSRTRLWPRPEGATPVVGQDASLVHNALGHLIQVRRSDGVVEDNAYQPGGLRFLRQVSRDGQVVDRRHFVYDIQGRLLEEYDRSESVPRLIGRYFYFEGDAPIAADLAGSDGQLRRFYYLQDDAKSVIAVADADGVVRERIWYDPFGQPVIEPRDEVPPAIRRVLHPEEGTYLVEFSEPVTPIVDDPGIGIGPARFNARFEDLVNEPAGGSTEIPESVPGFAPYTVLVLKTKEVLRGEVSLSLAPGRLTDDWGNHVAAQKVTLSVQGTPGEVCYAAPGGLVTDGGTAARSTVGSPFLFQGQYFDEETGLLYLRARFLDVRNAMFLEPDPSGYEDSVNLYAGFRFNPTSFRDPTGRITIKSEGNKNRVATQSRVSRIELDENLVPTVYGKIRPQLPSLESDRVAKKLVLGVNHEGSVRRVAEHHDANELMAEGDKFLSHVEKHAKAAGSGKGNQILIHIDHFKQGGSVGEKLNSAVHRGRIGYAEEGHKMIHGVDMTPEQKMKFLAEPLETHGYSPKPELAEVKGGLSGQTTLPYSYTDIEMYLLHRHGALADAVVVVGEFGERDLGTARKLRVTK